MIGASLVVLLVFFLVQQTGDGFSLFAHQGTAPRAAIVDHLSSSSPNPGFVAACTTLMRRAGYDVDYYKSEDVTVDFYRRLPAYGYKLIVLRVHSAYIPKYLSLAMFTSEPYSKQKYVYEQLRNRVASGYIEPYQEGDPRFLVITDKFVRHSMEGAFDDTVMVMMGCTGIKKCAATAFVEKGARVYVGWNGPVSAGHTDRATLQFLKHFLTEKQTIAEAVRGTMEEIGSEPQYKSALLFWPIEAGQHSVKASVRDFAASEPAPYDTKTDRRDDRGDTRKDKGVVPSNPRT